MSEPPLRGKDYLDKFNCKEFFGNHFCSAPISVDELGPRNFRMLRVHEFYEQNSSKWDKDRARMLEFGGGPVINGLISPAPHVREIVFSAYSENERSEIEQWKAQGDHAHDWSAHIQYVVNKLEGKEGDAAWRDREAQIRSRISRIIPCDITLEYPLGVEEEPFTIVSTSLCLEAASESYTDYKRNVKRLSTLLKPGGYLTMFAVVKETFYVVGDHPWYCLYLTRAEIEVALKEAGFTIVVNEYESAPDEHIQNPTASDYKGVLFIVGQKK